MAPLVTSCGSPSSSHPEGSWRNTIQPSRVNESLYKLREPPSAPSMVILFFHGFYSSESEDVQFCTWQSEDGSSIWPEAWLAGTFPSAQILYVSYKANVGMRPEGKLDMYTIGENLVSDFLQANIGQTPNCPIALVGYCFGGLVIKQLCLHISKRVNLTKVQSEKTRLENFLGNIKVVFYYGAPHRGSPCVDTVTNTEMSPLLEYFKILSTSASRLNFEFSHLCEVYGDWRIQGLGENSATRWGPFKGVVVAPEACARDGDQFNVVETDHIAICRSLSKTDRRFYALESLLHSIANNAKASLSGEVATSSTRSMLGDQCQGLPRYPIDLEKRAQDVVEKLRDGSVVGIFGMGGIGKTTLAKKVYNNISKDFEYTCFVENVKTFSNYKLKDYLLHHFHRHGCRVTSIIQWADLKEKQVLIVMDDVDSEDQLLILPELHHFGNGSRIIMTSRDKEIFKVYENCNIHEVEFLNSDEAKKLFCRHAFRGWEDIPDSLTHMKRLNENVTRVVRKCDGLPLTLEVMGRYLRDHENDASVWEETIDKLGKAKAIVGSRNDRVWASLKVSYDALAKEEQEMFIEAAMYFSDQPLEWALAAWSTSIESPKTRWANLVSRSMVKEDQWPKYDSVLEDYETVKTVWVHEQLRDLASSLAKGVIQYGFNEEATKLVDLLNSNKMKEETEYLQLRFFHGNSATVNFDSLIKLQKLKYLQFDGVMLEGSGQNFPSKLSILSWKQDASTYPMFTINLDEMNHLAILQLQGWDIPKKFLGSLGNLTNLRILELRDLDFQTFPESLGKLLALEHLTLNGLQCSQLPESLGDLSSLVTLRVCNCRNLSSLPTSFGRNLMSLKNMWIRHCPLLDGLPESFSQLSGLQRLEIIRCESFKNLGESFGNLGALCSLILVSTSIERLPTNFGLLSQLEVLRLDESGPLKILPENFGQLTALKKLEIRRGELELLPESFGLLTSLEDLNLECNNLVRFPESFGELPRLEALKLEVDFVRALPDSLGKLSKLKSLSITASSLGNLPTSMGQLSSLRNLSLYCWSLEKLSNNFGELSSLEELNIRSAFLETLLESIGQLQSLQSLSLIVEHMRTLPESMGGSSLFLSGHSTEILPEGVGSVRSLENLEFHDMPLKRLPEELGSLPCLRNLQIIGCRYLETLPQSLGHMSSLQEINLECCQSLKRLPYSWGGPSSSQVALPQAERRNEIINVVEGAFSQTKAMEGLRLVISRCPHLTISVLTSFGFVRETGKSVQPQHGVFCNGDCGCGVHIMV